MSTLRLFENEVLYCEGLYKPTFRGKIHLASLIAFPYALFYLYKGTNGLTYPFFIALISLITNFVCFATSALYHIFDWSLETEIILQKMDHCFISLWCVGMMFPIAFLLFPLNTGIIFICISSLTCAVNFYNIYNSAPSIIVSSIVPCIVLLFTDLCYKYMTDLEWRYMWYVFAFQIAGTIVFKAELFLANEIFGFHELFHLLSLFAAYYVYMLNYSIAIRYDEQRQDTQTQDTKGQE
jgi:hemolysin III